MQHGAAPWPPGGDRGTGVGPARRARPTQRPSSFEPRADRKDDSSRSRRRPITRDGKFLSVEARARTGEGALRVLECKKPTSWPWGDRFFSPWMKGWGRRTGLAFWWIGPRGRKPSCSPLMSNCRSRHQNPDEPRVLGFIPSAGDHEAGRRTGVRGARDAYLGRGKQRKNARPHPITQG